MGKINFQISINNNSKRLLLFHFLPLQPTFFSSSSGINYLLISLNMREDQEKSPIYSPSPHLRPFSPIIRDGRGQRSLSPVLRELEEPVNSDQSALLGQKLSADDPGEENSKEIFSQNTINQLYVAQSRQEKFMQTLQQLRDGIIQHQVISHISHQGEKYERLNFSMVREYTKSRIDKMMKNRKVKRNWSSQDLKILVWVVAKYCERKKIRDVYTGIEEEDWKQISLLIPGTTSEMCMFKWLSLRKSKVRDQKWQKREEALLEELVMQTTSITIRHYGEKNWSQISKQLFYQNPNKNKVYRCGKQCRQHWNCFLNPNIKKGNWTKEQDELLVELVFQAKGKKHWAKMVGRFGGRTQNALKNRYSIIIEREIAKYDQKMAQMKILQKLMEQKYMEELQPQYTQKQADREAQMLPFGLDNKVNKSIETIDIIQRQNEDKIQEELLEVELNEVRIEQKEEVSKKEEKAMLINPSKVVELSDDRLEELRKKSSHLFYAFQKNQTFLLTHNHALKKIQKEQTDH